jgi:hypothetical protein
MYMRPSRSDGIWRPVSVTPMRPRGLSLAARTTIDACCAASARAIAVIWLAMAA